MPDIGQNTIELYKKEETDGGRATAGNQDIKISTRSVVAKDEQEVVVFSDALMIFFVQVKFRSLVALLQALLRIWCWWKRRENRTVLSISLAFLRILA
jgi:hypothetical protein